MHGYLGYLLGQANHALYKEIWISHRIRWIPEGKVGCALVAAPYLVLAKDAVPEGRPERLLKMTISEWEQGRPWTRDASRRH